MANDDDEAGTNEPGNSSKGRRDKTDGDGNDVETGVELRGGGAESADLEIAAVELANDKHARGDKDDVEQKPPVGQEGVDAQHDKDDGIVAGEVAEVVVDTRLHLAKVLRLGEALDVKELGDGAQVGEARGQRRRPDAVEAVAELEARGDHFDRDLDAGGHFGGLGGGERLGREGKRKRKKGRKKREEGGRGQKVSGDEWGILFDL